MSRTERITWMAALQPLRTITYSSAGSILSREDDMTRHIEMFVAMQRSALRNATGRTPRLVNEMTNGHVGISQLSCLVQKAARY